MTVLLDGNVLVALAVADHVDHRLARTWWTRTTDPFATCPITQGTLIRFLVRKGFDTTTALGVLRGFTGHERHRFWPADVALDEVSMRGVIGHRQVTDAHLAGLTRRHHGHLLTLDQGLAALHDDVVELLTARPRATATP